LNENYDLAIVVDCGVKSLLGRAEQLFDKAEKTLRIDHHPNSQNFAQVNIVDPDASCAAQVIMKLIDPLGVKLTKNIASDLYMALITDTKGFSYLKNPVNDFKDAQELAKTGIDAGLIKKIGMNSTTRPLLTLKANIIQKIKYVYNGSIAYIIEDEKLKKTFPKSLMKESSTADINNIFQQVVADLQNIENVKIGFTVREVNNGTKISLRGNGVTVNDIAKQLGGGGHPFAAACVISKKPENALKLIIKICKEKINNTSK
jgi:phosphoesterase RecJ-like protein